MKYILIITVTVLFLVSCGGSSSKGSGGTTPPPSANIDMVVGQSYSLYNGDTIVKDTDIGKVSIRHIDGQNVSTVELLEGSATIIR